MVYRHLLNFWPLVPAVDIQAIFEAIKTANEDEIFEDFDVPFTEFEIKHSFLNLPISEPGTKENRNILIVGDGLGCLIKTISRMYRHGALNLNIYVVSNFPESLARDLMLLSLFNDSSSTMGILEKAEMFLEIFGNTLLRASTSEFVETKSGNILDDIVSCQSVLSVPAISLTFLKQKEIDDICKVLTFLKNKDPFEIANAWENSLRAYFGTRYDSRKNLFDYHYNLKLSQYPIISLRKYLEWCETGIAFKLRKGRYNKPNKTFCVNSMAKSSGFYVGDIATSPYITYGVECKNEAMLRKENDQYVNTSEDISKFHVIDFMSEFSSSKSSEVYKKLGVYFLFYSTFCKTRKFEEFFDAIYITCDMTSYAEKYSVSKLLNENGMVVFETVNNVVNSTKDQKKKHLEDIDRFARKSNLKLGISLKSTADNFKIYVRNDNV